MLTVAQLESAMYHVESGLWVQHWQSAQDRELLIAVMRHGWGNWAPVVHSIPAASLAAMRAEIGDVPQDPSLLPAGELAPAGLRCCGLYVLSVTEELVG